MSEYQPIPPFDEGCPHCDPAGYLHHHPYCPNAKPPASNESDSVILEAWQELKEKIICGESFAQKIKPFFLKAIAANAEKLRNEIASLHLNEQKRIGELASLLAELGKAQAEVLELKRADARLQKLTEMIWETRWITDHGDYQTIVGIAAEIRSGNFATIDAAISNNQNKQNT